MGEANALLLAGCLLVAAGVLNVIYPIEMAKLRYWPLSRGLDLSESSEAVRSLWTRLGYALLGIGALLSLYWVVLQVESATA